MKHKHRNNLEYMISKLKKTMCFFCKCPVNIEIDEYTLLNVAETIKISHIDCFKSAEGWIYNYNLFNSISDKQIAQAFLKK